MPTYLKDGEDFGAGHFDAGFGFTGSRSKSGPVDTEVRGKAPKNSPRVRAIDEFHRATDEVDDLDESPAGEVPVKGNERFRLDAGENPALSRGRKGPDAFAKGGKVRKYADGGQVYPPPPGMAGQPLPQVNSGLQAGGPQMAAMRNPNWGAAQAQAPNGAGMFGPPPPPNSQGQMGAAQAPQAQMPQMPQAPAGPVQGAGVVQPQLRKGGRVNGHYADGGDVATSDYDPGHGDDPGYGTRSFWDQAAHDRAMKGFHYVPNYQDASNPADVEYNNPVQRAMVKANARPAGYNGFNAGETGIGQPLSRPEDRMSLPNRQTSDTQALSDMVGLDRAGRKPAYADYGSSSPRQGSVWDDVGLAVTGAGPYNADEVPGGRYPNKVSPTRPKQAGRQRPAEDSYEDAYRPGLKPEAPAEQSMPTPRRKPSPVARALAESQDVGAPTQLYQPKSFEREAPTSSIGASGPIDSGSHINLSGVDGSTVSAGDYVYARGGKVAHKAVGGRMQENPLSRATISMPAEDAGRLARNLVNTGARMSQGNTSRNLANATRGLPAADRDPSYPAPLAAQAPTGGPLAGVPGASPLGDAGAGGPPLAASVPAHAKGGFLKSAIKHPGRMKEGAAHEGVSTHAYMTEHEHDPGSLGSAARLGLRLSGGEFRKKEKKS